MNQKVIPLADERQLRQLPAIPTALTAPTGRLVDRRGRAVKDLRISVTDRCNFRCVYCMPKAVFNDDYSFLPRQSLLSFEDDRLLGRTPLERVAMSPGVYALRVVTPGTDGERQVLVTLRPGALTISHVPAAGESSAP